MQNVLDILENISSCFDDKDGFGAKEIANPNIMIKIMVHIFILRGSKIGKMMERTADGQGKDIMRLLSQKLLVQSNIPRGVDGILTPLRVSFWLVTPRRHGTSQNNGRSTEARPVQWIYTWVFLSE